METSLDDYVTFRLVKAAKSYMRLAQTRLAELDLQPGQDQLLRQLWDTDGLSQSELIARLNVEPPTVTKAIGRMEKAGLLSRKRDPEDARVQRVFLTRQGRQLREPVTKLWAELESLATADFSPQEKEGLRELLLRIRANLSEPGPTSAKR